MVRKFRKLAHATARKGGRVTFEWPRHCAGWALKEIQELIKELGRTSLEAVETDHHGQQDCQNFLRPTMLT